MQCSSGRGVNELLFVFIANQQFRKEEFVVREWTVRAHGLDLLDRIIVQRRRRMDARASLELLRGVNNIWGASVWHVRRGWRTPTPSVFQPYF